MLGCLIEDLKIIICYLGNGVLIIVVDGGKLVDILMGFIFFVGVIMGICLGDVDVLLLFYLMIKFGLIDV